MQQHQSGSKKEEKLTNNGELQKNMQVAVEVALLTLLCRQVSLLRFSLNTAH